MKVTKKTSPGGQKSNRPGPALSQKIKKLLTEKQKAGLILFENKLSRSGAPRVAASQKIKTPIAINVIENPLDAYSSPFLLDLSGSRFIEKVKPARRDINRVAYEDLPGGEILSKLYIFELLSLADSEIIIWFKNFWQRIIWTIKAPWQKIDLSPKLPLLKDNHLSKIANKKISLWQEVALINFFSFISAFIYKLFLLIYWLGEYFYQNWRQFYQKDEIINFGQQKDVLVGGKVTAASLPIYPLFKVGLKKPALNAGQKTMPRLKLPPLKIPWPRLQWSDFFTLNFKSKFWVREFSFRPLLAFLLVALFITLPIKSFLYWRDVNEVKGEVLGQAEEALFNLELAQSELANFNFKNAEDYFSFANKNFVSAQNQLRAINYFLTTIAEILPFSSAFKSGKNLLNLGEYLAKAGEHLLIGINGLIDQSDLTLTEKVKNFQKIGYLALTELKLAQLSLSQVDLKYIPLENREKFVVLKKQLPNFIASLEKSEAIINFVIKLLGDNDLKRYLLVFQNDNELRATGGFMGSFALLDLKSGNIQKMTMPGGGTYDVRAGFNELLLSPKPLQIINARWEFQDANWWPDWPTSAQNIAWFYAKSGGPTVDGVLAINSDWLGELLAVVGEVALPDYAQKINSANFELELQKSVELKFANQKQPKKILSDLAPELIKRIFALQPEKLLDLIAAVDRGLENKDILVYLSDEELEKFVLNNNWGGQIRNTGGDYLSIVAANIGGGKTDEAIKQRVYHQAEILADGSIIDRLLINRYHFGPIDKNFTNQPNRSYLRVYVPLGSELVEAAGFSQPLLKEYQPSPDFLATDPRLIIENQAMIDNQSQTKIYEEADKTVFANWSTVEPGESENLLLVYKLPIKLDLTNLAPAPPGLIGKIKAAFLPREHYDSYSLLVQKQPGSDNDSEFVSQLVYPPNLTPQSTDPTTIRKEAGNIIYENELNSDLFYLADFKY